MFRNGIPIGKAFGITLRLHYSWFLIFILITWTLTAAYYPTAYPHWSLGLKIGAGLLTSVLFFGSVLVHELMHSIVALHQGLQIRAITLFFLGGVSEISGEPRTAGDEFRMAGAGPLSSLVLGGILIGIYYVLRGSGLVAAQFGAAVTFYLGYTNVILGIFNLIPGFPLDGGRVFRSIIWWRTRNLQKATKIASTIGRGFGFLFILGGIYLVFVGQFFNGILLALVGWFLESAAGGSYQQMLLQDTLKGHVAREVMSQDCTFISPSMTIEKLVNENILTSGRRCFPVVSDNYAEGLITIHNIKAVPRELWSTRTVRDTMTPMASLKSVHPDEDLNTVLQLLTENDINQVPVIYNNQVIGMVARDSIINFIKTRTELGKR